MAFNGPMISDTVVAGEDLSGKQYRFITANGSLATESDLAYGVLQDKPESGQHGAVCVVGITKVIAGGALTKGAKFKVASGGFATAVASGDGVPAGVALVAANSGDTVAAFVNGVSAQTLFNGA